MPIDGVAMTILVGGERLMRESLMRLLGDTCFFPKRCLDQPEELEGEPPDERVTVIVIAGFNEHLGALVEGVRGKLLKSRIILLANESNRDSVYAALEAGANAVLMTSISVDGFMKTLHALSSDEIRVLDARLGAPSGSPAEPKRAQTSGGRHVRSLQLTKELSAREIEIVQCIATGDSNKVIARRLDIAEATVKAHVKAVLSKLGANNRTQLALWATTQEGSPASNSGESAIARETASIIPHERVLANRPVLARLRH